MNLSFFVGDQIGVHYDPMIAKLIVSGENRDRAIKLLQKSLTEFNVVGVRTNIEFIQRILDTNNYKDVSQIDTGFIQVFGHYARWIYLYIIETFRFSLHFESASSGRYIRSHSVSFAHSKRILIRKL